MKVIKRLTLAFLFGGCVLLVVPAHIQAQQQPLPENQQSGPGGDPIRDLNLSPEQRERIRAIREDQRDERAAINQHLRETNRALEEVLDSDNPSEALVEKHLRDVAEAQAASLRMRVATEMKVRKVLTPEQLTTLRMLRQNARDMRREQQIENNQRRRERIERRGLPSRNSIAPVFPRRLDPNRRPQP
ncbi:MAG TPA: Spy/CpxP family protein refolding chaperone [Pyrinomonadaceae bacterium]|nr:Spy/CpxP family protein refolding chaperone [Pyrinomonadaceae bacterium]